MCLAPAHFSADEFLVESHEEFFGLGNQSDADGERDGEDNSATANDVFDDTNHALPPCVRVAEAKP